MRTGLPLETGKPYRAVGGFPGLARTRRTAVIGAARKIETDAAEDTTAVPVSEFIDEEYRWNEDRTLRRKNDTFRGSTDGVLAVW